MARGATDRRPALIVNNTSCHFGRRSMYKHILIPTDGSPQSKKAIAGAIALAKSIGAQVTGLFAAPPATPIVYRNHLPAGLTTMAEHKAAIEKSAAAYLGIIEQA